MHVNSWATIRRSISLCAVSRFGVIASISSIKTIHGAISYESQLILWSRVVLFNLCLVKDFSDFLLRFTRHSRDNRGSGDVYERDLHFLFSKSQIMSRAAVETYPSDRVSKQGLSTTRRSVKQDSSLENNEHSSNPKFCTSAAVFLGAGKFPGVAKAFW